MSIESTFCDSMAIQRRSTAGTDRHGMPIETWATVYSDVPCRLRPLNATELTPRNDDTLVVTHLLYASAGTDLLHDDRVVIGGTVFAVLNPVTYKNGMGANHMTARAVEVRE